jgi:tetratricopeptide (TPR) repeat protein
MEPTFTSGARSELDALIERAATASQDGDSNTALSLLEQAMALEKASAAACFLFASEHASLGNFEKAEESFANTVLLAPQWHIARYQLGLLQFSSGRAAAALVTWAPLFDLDASNCFVHFVRGFGSLAQDQFAQATAHFRAGLALPVENAALAGDIEKVLARIEHLTTGPVAQTAEPSAAAHILVANYGRFGSLH